ARDARAECAPLDADRYKIAFTASASLKEKLEAARALVSHSLPDAILADIVERALDVLLERERARRFAVRQQRGPKERHRPRTERERRPASGGRQLAARRVHRQTRRARARRGAGWQRAPTARARR